MEKRWQTVVETAAYLTDCKGVIDEGERREIVTFLARNPESGVSIGGGIRKVRFARTGGGKSGGYRVVFLFGGATLPLFLLAAFAKNEKANLSETERKTLISAAQSMISTYGSAKS
jgi:hypothetical protein